MWCTRHRQQQGAGNVGIARDRAWMRRRIADTVLPGGARSCAVARLDDMDRSMRRSTSQAGRAQTCIEHVKRLGSGHIPVSKSLGRRGNERRPRSAMFRSAGCVPGKPSLTFFELAACYLRSSCPNEAGRTPAPHFRLFVLGGGDRSVERSAQLLGAFECQLDTGARPWVKSGVDEVERDNVGQRCMARMVIGDYRPRERKPFIAALGNAIRTDDLDNRRAHVRSSYFARCFPKKLNTLLQPSIVCSGR